MQLHLTVRRRGDGDALNMHALLNAHDDTSTKRIAPKKPDDEQDGENHRGQCQAENSATSVLHGHQHVQSDPQ